MSLASKSLIHHSLSMLKGDMKFNALLLFRKLLSPAENRLGAKPTAILTALAAYAVSKGHRESSALVWAASDHEVRGCALLSK